MMTLMPKLLKWLLQQPEFYLLQADTRQGRKARAKALADAVFKMPRGDQLASMKHAEGDRKSPLRGVF